MSNHGGKGEFTGTVALGPAGSEEALEDWIDEGESDPLLALLEGTLASMRTSLYDEGGHHLVESRAYFALPVSGEGTEGTHYDSTLYGYDGMGRKVRAKEAHGTITRTAYDELGRAWRTFAGTNDSNSAGGESGGDDDMVKVSELTFDLNGRVTKRTLYVEGSDTGKRETGYAHDFRGRALLTTNPHPPHTLVKYDNLGRVVAAAGYSATGSITPGTTDPAGSDTNDKANRVSLSQSAYDEMGRAWKTTRCEITPGTGVVNDSVDSLTWYDPVGRTIKVRGEGGHAKHIYDRLGRRERSFDLARDDDADYEDVYDGGVTDLAGDIVLEETQIVYGSTDSDNVLMRVVIRRHHDDLGNGTAGPLDLNDDDSSPDLRTLTAEDVMGRVSITRHWYDALDRVTHSVRYGANGIVGDRSTATGTFDAAGASLPTRPSVSALITTHVYNDDGTLKEVEAPGKPSNAASGVGTRTRFEYDRLFRQTKVVRNYVDGTAGGGTHGDEDQVVEYGYTNGLRTSITAANPGASTQVTKYIYGTTVGEPGMMAIGTGHLLRAVIYPDSTNTGTTSGDIDSDSSDVASYAYNAQGEPVLATDQAGNILRTDYDTAGREIHKRAANIESGFDTRVHRISTGYDGRGMVQTVTQYDDEDPLQGEILDQVEYQYDGWGNLELFTQDPDSEIGVSGRDEFAVGYAHAKATPSGSRPAVRRTYDGRSDGAELSLEYSSAGNRLDHAVSRVTRINHGLVTAASYEYLGTGQVVGTLLDEVNFYSRRYGGSTGVYPGFDGHGRVIEDRWTKFANSAERNFYHVSLSYDANSNITLIEDHVHLSAPLVSSGIGRFDAAYTMDDLDRLIRAEEGHWGGSSISTRARDEDWRDEFGPASQLDHMGNWGHYLLDVNGNGDFTDGGDLDETRTHNIANELTDRDPDSGGPSSGYVLDYDPVGNLVDDGENYKYVYDVFGRLVRVTDQGDGMVTEYRYNGLGYRSGMRSDSWENDAGVDELWFYFCYDERWRIVATYRHEPDDSGTDDEDAKESFVYHAAGFGGFGTSSYIDAVVLRDDDSSPWVEESNGRDRRVYPMQNWRNDTSLVVTAGGTLVEFVKYSAYGVPFGLPAFDTNANGQNDVQEFTHYIALIGATAWDARADVDTDGDVDSNDVALWPGLTLGRGVLSSVDSRKGYAGYEFDPILLGAKWHVRHRVLDSELGRWTRRDPLEYKDNLNLYSAAGDSPIRYVDPLGLCIECTDTLSFVADSRRYRRDNETFVPPAPYPIPPKTPPSITVICGCPNTDGFGPIVPYCSPYESTDPATGIPNNDYPPDPGSQGFPAISGPDVESIWECIKQHTEHWGQSSIRR